MINEQIRDREIRLIGQNGEQLGIMSARDAYLKAQEAGLDLVKIAPTNRRFAKLSTTESTDMNWPARKKKQRKNRKQLKSRKFAFLQTLTPMILIPK